MPRRPRGVPALSDPARRLAVRRSRRRAPRGAGRARPGVRRQGRLRGEAEHELDRPRPDVQGDPQPVRRRHPPGGRRLAVPQRLPPVPAPGGADRGRSLAGADRCSKLASPGAADVYQGCELWDFSMVDPDNRRPVDFEACAAASSNGSTPPSPSGRPRRDLARDLLRRARGRRDQALPDLDPAEPPPRPPRPLPPRRVPAGRARRASTRTGWSRSCASHPRPQRPGRRPPARRPADGRRRDPVARRPRRLGRDRVVPPRVGPARWRDLLTDRSSRRPILRRPPRLAASATCSPTCRWRCSVEEPASRLREATAVDRRVTAALSVSPVRVGRFTGGPSALGRSGPSRASWSVWTPRRRCGGPNGRRGAVPAAGDGGQVGEAVAADRRAELPGREPPGPVPVGTARDVHPSPRCRAPGRPGRGTITVSATDASAAADRRPVDAPRRRPERRGRAYARLGRRAALCPALAAEPGREPAGGRLVVVRPGVGDAVVDVGVRQVELGPRLAVEPELHDPHPGQVEPVAQGQDLGRDVAQVFGHDRQAAERRRGPPPGTPRPARGPSGPPRPSSAPAGTSQYASNPRKWSSRTRSTRASCAFRRPIHQANPSAACASQR